MMGRLILAWFSLCTALVFGQATVSPNVAKPSNKKVYADVYQRGEDVGAAIKAAHDALPKIGGAPTGVISLEGYEGTVVLKTPIDIDSHSISVVGPGKNILTLDCMVPTGDCIRIRDKTFGQGGWVHGPYISGLSLIGHNNPNVVGIHIGDMFRLHLQDVLVYGFTGENDIGILFDNNVGYTEQLNMTDVQVSNNTTGMVFTNRNGTPGKSQSYGYGNYVNVFIQVGPGQTGLSIDGGSATMLPLIYHSQINWIFEDLREGGQNTLMRMAPNSALLDNTYSIFIEDQARNGGPWLQMADNSAFTGFGYIQSWGRSVELGNNVIFNVLGRVEIQAADWSPVNGRIALDPHGKWGSGASIEKISGQWQLFTFTIKAGSNPQPDPTVAVRFPNPNGQTTWRNPPLYMCKQVGGTGGLMTISGEDTASMNAMYLNYHGAPSPGNTYIVNCHGAAR
jgi:hypothetical protein